MNCYHSTLVTAFAAALTLARTGPADSAADPRRIPDTGAAGQRPDLVGPPDGGAV